MGPALFRLIILACIGLAIAGLTSPAWGIVVVIAGLLLEVLMHLNYIAKLSQWLEDPDPDAVPSSASHMWTEIYTRIHSSRKALEKNTKRLSDREARYRKTLAALPEGIVLVKNDWVVSWCNETAEHVFGINNEADTGRHMLALVTDDAFNRYIRAADFSKPLLWSPAGSNCKLEVRIVIADRKNALIVTRDITEQERLDAMRRDFVANVSHELRTPLTVLTGFLDMALHGITQRVQLQRQHLELMRDQADRMQRLITDLLTLSRLENDSDSKTTEPIRIDSLVASITQEIRVMCAGSHTVQCEVSPALMMGYPDEIRSAIVNLMTNAVRYTPEGGHISAACTINAEGGIEVSVRDDGIGIAQKDIPRLTERFYRVDKSRSRDTGGTGLGLAIVKHVLLHHNANMRISSDLGKGSTFTFVFPSELRREISAATSREQSPIG